jgi:hypothetical protein
MRRKKERKNGLGNSRTGSGRGSDGRKSQRGLSKEATLKEQNATCTIYMSNEGISSFH